LNGCILNLILNYLALARILEASDASNAFTMLMKGAQTSAVLSKHNSKVKQSKSPNPALKRKYYNTTGKRRIPDFKKIMGTYPPIVVDGFEYASQDLTNIYFLTHFHSDHYMGLTKV